MLRGRFDKDGAAFIEGRLILPRLRIWTDLSFLVDTGADTTRLNPFDGLWMGLDYSKLQRSGIRSIGIGGVVDDYEERAVVIFSEGALRFWGYDVRLAIAPPTEDINIMSLPSILGRDILNRWDMRYNPSRKMLQFKVISADSRKVFRVNLSER